jgi:hypothetical protein
MKLYIYKQIKGDFVFYQEEEREKERRKKSSSEPHHLSVADTCLPPVRSWCAAPNTITKGGA